MCQTIPQLVLQHPWASIAGWNVVNGRATRNVHVRNVSLHLTSNCALRISWHISMDTWIHVRVLEQYCSQATRDNAIAFHAVKIYSVVQYYMHIQCKQGLPLHRHANSHAFGVRYMHLGSIHVHMHRLTVLMHFHA